MAHFRCVVDQKAPNQKLSPPITDHLYFGFVSRREDHKHYVQKRRDARPSCPPTSHERERNTRRGCGSEIQTAREKVSTHERTHRGTHTHTHGKSSEGGECLCVQPPTDGTDAASASPGSVRPATDGAATIGRSVRPTRPASTPVTFCVRMCFGLRVYM